MRTGQDAYITKVPVEDFDVSVDGFESDQFVVSW
jgi:hypothetical protein